MASLLDAMLVQNNPLRRGLLADTGVGQPGVGGVGGVQEAPAPSQPSLSGPAPRLLEQAGGAPVSPLQGRAAPPQQPQQPPGPPDTLKKALGQAASALRPKSQGSSEKTLDTRETLLATGLALLGGGPDITMAQALAQGVFAGRQAALASNAAAAAERQAQARAQQYVGALGDGPLTKNKLDTAITIAIANDDQDTLKVLEDLRAQMPEKPDIKPITVGDTIFGFDPSTGAVTNADGEKLSSEEQAELARQAPEPQIKMVGGIPIRIHPDSGNVTTLNGAPLTDADIQALNKRSRNPILRQRIDDAGNVFQFEWDPESRTAVPGTEFRIENADGDPATDTAKADFLQRELTVLQQLLGDDPSTQEIELPDADQFRSVAGKFGLIASNMPNTIRNKDVQKLKSSVNSLVLNIAREMQSGVLSDKDIEFVESFLAPKPGDSRETVLAKMERIQAFVDIVLSSSADAAFEAVISGQLGGDPQDIDADRVLSILNTVGN